MRKEKFTWENAPGIITTVQLAQLAGVNYQTVFTWIRGKKLPAQKKSGKWLFEKKDALKFCRERIKRATPSSWENAPEYINAGQAASLLKVTFSTVIRWISQEKLPAVKIGQAWQIRAMDAYEHSREHKLSQLPEMENPA